MADAQDYIQKTIDSPTIGQGARKLLHSNDVAGFGGRTLLQGSDPASTATAAAQAASQVWIFDRLGSPFIFHG